MEGNDEKLKNEEQIKSVIYIVAYNCYKNDSKISLKSALKISIII
jgi:hypothetical protein